MANAMTPLYPVNTLTPTQQGAAGIGKGAVAGAAGAGVFDVGGSPILRNLLRRHAMRSARNRMRSAGTLNRLIGADPMQARQNLIDVNRENTGQVAGSLGEADLAMGQQQNQFLQGLLGHQMDSEEARRQWDEAHKSRVGAWLGQLLGTGVGAFAGGYGASLGGRLGKQAGGTWDTSS